jgi:hypothetical protein
VGTELILGAIDPPTEARGRAAVFRCRFAQVAAPTGNDGLCLARSGWKAWCRCAQQTGPQLRGSSSLVMLLAMYLGDRNSQTGIASGGKAR